MNPSKKSSSKNRSLASSATPLPTSFGAAAAGLAILALGAMAACSSAPDEASGQSSNALITPLPVAPHPALYATFPTGATAFGAADLENAYNIPTYMQPNTTIAIIEVGGDDPNAESDLAYYRNAYALPPCASSTGCLTKVTETGSTTGLPPATTVSPISGISPAGIFTSTALDMASAGCPNCKLLVVELPSGALTSDLLTAVSTAKGRGASAIVSTASWSSEFDTLPADDSALAKGVTVFAGIQQSPPFGSLGTTVSDYPASSPNVVSVGLTNLVLPNGLSVTPSLSESASPSGWTECAAGAKPSGQPNAGCASRAVNDVAATGGPVWTFNTFQSTGAFDLTSIGWVVQGGPGSVSDYGTPVSNIIASTLVAAIFAQTGNGAVGPDYPYANPTFFNDVTTGAVVENGATCAGAMCNAGVGYDGPTGMGTPDGMDMAHLNRLLLCDGPGTVDVDNDELGSQGTGIIVVSPGLTNSNYVAEAETTWASGCPLSISFSGAPAGVTPSAQVYELDKSEPWALLSLAVAAGTPLGEQSTLTVAGTACGVTHYLQYEVLVEACVPTQTSCSSSVKCGSIVNNCGQTIECGSCASGETCSNGGCCASPLVWNGERCAPKTTCTTAAECCIQAGGNWTGGACE